jgi:retron-type reverse transcriptase
VSARAEEEIALIARLLQEDRYEPQAVRRTWIEKRGSSEKRPLGIPTVRDRRGGGRDKGGRRVGEPS